MTGICPFKLALEPAHRADPYPLYAAMPRVPTRIDGERFVIRDYQQVMSLLHDPRLSSAIADGIDAHAAENRVPSLLKLDPPEHDRLRRITMRQFGPPHRINLVADLEDEIIAKTHALIDALASDRQADVVSRFAHQLPVSIICKLMDIPRSDEGRFHEWVADIIGGFGTGNSQTEAMAAAQKLGAYLTEMAMGRRGDSGTDMLSGLVNDEGPEGRLPDASIGAMATLLLIAGHETTVNLIGNGILTLIRHPAEALRLRQDPVRAVAIVEELLRFEPPVQFVQNRTTMADIELGGVIIPKGSTVVLLLAAANRDSAQFAAADQFDPDRRDNQHLGFGSGIHSCFGAPLARLEAQIALRFFFERVVNPRIVGEPRYRPSPLLRGPSELIVAYDGVCSEDMVEQE
jgi:cytochrome P450